MSAWPQVAMLHCMKAPQGVGDGAVRLSWNLEIVAYVADGDGTIPISIEPFLRVVIRSGSVAFGSYPCTTPHGPGRAASTHVLLRIPLVHPRCVSSELPCLQAVLQIRPAFEAGGGVSYKWQVAKQWLCPSIPRVCCMVLP